MEPKAILSAQKQEMDKTLDHAVGEFNSLHTGKASPAMVEGVPIEVVSYGATMPLRDIAAVTTPDPRTISIQPWDKSTLKDIERALQKANLGINPVIDGNIVRLSIPELSGERRQELVKVAHQMAEESRIALRHARREALDSLKALEKEGEISEDDVRRFEKDVQKATDDYSTKIGEALEHKEKELLTV